MAGAAILPPMGRFGFVVMCLAALAAGCDRRPAAAGDVQRLLAAAHSGDRAGFEARIDRPALRQDLRRQLSSVAIANDLEVEGGPPQSVLDRMISPDALVLVEAETGRPLTAPPTLDEVSRQMRTIGKDRACLQSVGAPERCLLVFVKSPGLGPWRLTAMPAAQARIPIQRDGGR
jgi:Protein of unknown function (DUF2939)